MLRNCLKKGFRPVAVLVVTVLMCSLGGCSDSESGWLEGRAFTMNAYSNTGELTLTSHAEKIGLDGNVTTDSRYYGIGTNGSVSSGSTDSLSSVITVTLDGRELDSCGDTLIFTEDGLEPVKDFAADALKSQDTEKTTGTGSTSQLLNRYKDSFAKKHVVVIKSQMGTPIEVFNGDTIKWDIDDNLPKTTRLMVDGKTLYIHRANFQILDKDSLQ